MMAGVLRNFWSCKHYENKQERIFGKDFRLLTATAWNCPDVMLPLELLLVLSNIKFSVYTSFHSFNFWSRRDR